MADRAPARGFANAYAAAKVVTTNLLDLRPRQLKRAAAIKKRSTDFKKAIMRSVLQVFSPQDANLALKHVGAAVNPSGKIYIIAQILDDSRRSPLGAVGFNLNL
jgi:hypothetical protein